MFIPLGTDRLPKRRVIVTPILIGVNLAAFVAMLLLSRADIASLDETIAFGAASRTNFHIWGLLTAAFLHDPHSLTHIGFNMLFLWVFGQAVESRLGSLGFAAFYLTGAIAASCAHMLVSPAPTIGASGAVAAVSGAFLVLFPRATIKVLFIFFIIGVYHIPAMWFIGLYIAIDVFSQLSEWLGSQGHIAYAAHLGGYAFGAAVAFTLLATKLLPRTEMDMLYLFKQSRRRKAMRNAVSDSQSSSAWQQPASRPLASKPDPLADRRRTVATHLSKRNYDQAQREYVMLLDEGHDVVLPEEQQLELANRLLTTGSIEHACRTYELLLEKRGDRPGIGASSNEIHLLLASILLRRLDRHADAKLHLQKIDPAMFDETTATLYATLQSECKEKA